MREKMCISFSDKRMKSINSLSLIPPYSSDKKRRDVPKKSNAEQTMGEGTQ